MKSLSLPGDAAAADAGKPQMKSDDAAAEGGNAQPPQVGAGSPRALVWESIC